MAISKTWEMRRNYSKAEVTKGIEKILYMYFYNGILAHHGNGNDSYILKMW